ncbi:Queuine tRNA-ribosyltransferase accessory subunit 2-like protein [Elsinoe fawcettii]|nr:Queuine tRNA-ribosyltransferase accessory subunit 2-like protein [Elsinoe fawcettii]
MADEADDEPNEAANRMFTIQTISKTCAARVGRLVLPRRSPLPTPNYIANTSRGAVPHVTPDVLVDSATIDTVYLALEDFIERAPTVKPPILSYHPPNGVSPLRSFCAFPDHTVLVLGARRVQPVTSPLSHTSNDVPVYTSTGFTKLSVSYYMDAVRHLKPDAFVALADIPFGAERYSQKRRETMTDRTSRWMLEQVKALNSSPRGDRPALLLPILPLEAEAQRWYFEEITDSLLEHVTGLAVYDLSSLQGAPPQFQELARLSFTQPATPQRILWEVSQGIDIFTVPFIDFATDAGIALDFRFPLTPHEGNGSVNGHVSKPLGVDMWSDEHTTDVSPLSRDCTCYACTTHHRAFLKHLLNAKEMLGWVLLQIHNHQVMNEFFAGIRKSIQGGTFEQDKTAFEREYEPSLPEKTGQGPRVRGYQFKSDGPGEVKRNQAPFKTMNDAKEKVAETADSNPVNDVEDIEGAGLAEKS